MKLLSSTQRVLAFGGLISGEQIFHFNYIHTIVSLLIFVTMVVMELSAAFSVVNHLLISELEKRFQAGFETAGAVPLIGSFVTFFYHKKSVRTVMDAFQKIFDECKRM